MADTHLLEAVRDLTRALAATSDLECCLRKSLEVAVRAVDATAGTIFLHSPDDRVLRFFYSVGAPQADAPTRVDFGLVGLEIAEDEGIAGEVFRTGIPQITEDAKLEPAHAKHIDEEFGFETRTIATLPLRSTNGEVYGVLQVINRRRSPFSKADVRTLQIVESILWMRASLGTLVNKN